MRNSKKLLSLLLVVLIGLTSIAVTSVAEIEPLTAYRFETANYNPALANNRPTTVKSSNDGSVRIKSDHIQHQYQLNFEVPDQQSMKDAIEEACDYESGFLSVNIAVNSALTAYGSACRPTVSVTLIGKDGSKIATTGENSLYSEQAGQFILDVTAYMEEGKVYDDDVKYVYVQIQCYNWGCGGGLGTQPDVTIYPIKVYDGQMEEEDLPTIATKKPDPNQTTFLNFSPRAKIDDNNAPEQIHYSGDGAVWRMAAFAKEENYGYTRFTQKVNSREQVQTAFGIEQMGSAAADALNLARMGSNYLQVSVTLQECLNMQNEPTIAEVSIGINTKEGTKPTAPPMVRVTAWQYPGTTRTYYLDVSNIEHISQVNNVVITVQNYWWYRSGTKEMFDWNVESGYGGKENAEKLGHVKSEIKPIIIVSPVTVYKGEREDVANTDYKLVLDDFNQNGGVVPNPITLVDPNADYGNDPDPTKTTAGGATTVTIPGQTAGGEQNVTTLPTNMTIPPVSVSPTKNPGTPGDCAHASTKVVGAKAATCFATGFSGNKVCVLCGQTVLAGKTIAKIKLAKPTITTKLAGKKIKVSYQKVAGGNKIQIRYRIKGAWTIKTYKATKNVTKTLKKLKKGKYKIQVRALCVSGKQTAYSKWSKVSKVKIK